MTGPQLPFVESQNPVCGACGSETDCDSGGDFVCVGCLLVYGDGIGGVLGRAKRLDPDAPVCGSACGRRLCPDLRGSGYAWVCYPCQLTAGHGSTHWHGCGVAS